MDLKEIGCESVAWIYFSHDRVTLLKLKLSSE
jgi:hypothetical protein